MQKGHKNYLNFFYAPNFKQMYFSIVKKLSKCDVCNQKAIKIQSSFQIEIPT